MPLILGTNSIKATGFDVANSCRFNVGSNDFLSRTIGTPTDEDKWTFSVWLKVTGEAPSVQYGILSAGNYPSAYETIHLNGSDQLFYHYNDGGGANHGAAKYSGIITDPSSWYNLIISRNGTAVKVYINGNDVTTTVTSYNNSTNVINKSGGTLRIGHSERETSGRSWNGYMSEVVFCDGQLLDETSFGEFDEDSPTIWKAKDVSGLTFGDNGFYLDFKDSSALGNDVSGNNNDFTANNLTAVDQSTDTCTNNGNTLNFLAQTPAKGTISEGNLEYDNPSGSANWITIASTIAANSGKYYYEYKIIDGGASAGNGSLVGLLDYNTSAFQHTSNDTLTDAGEYGWYGAGNTYINGSDAGVISSYTDGDIVMVAVDLDNSKIYFGKNGSWVNSGDPTSGATGTGGHTIANVSSGAFAFAVSHREGGNGQANFGSPPYSISSGNADGNGYGNFEYSVPSGYYTLNTKNLAEFG